MKKTVLILAFAVTTFLIGCGNNEKTTTTTDEQATTQEQPAPEAEAYDAQRGEGKYTAESLALTDKLDAPMAKKGEDAFGVKCASCHKTSDEKLVGPGLKDVTTRRTPEWIMNFITNPDPMLDKDPEAQAMLELCLVRMPNQNLSDDEARNILEFMRKIDGVK